MFYSHEEFKAQMQDLLDMGYPRDVAYVIVRDREDQEEMEYQDWRDALDIAIGEEMENAYA